MSENLIQDSNEIRLNENDQVQAILGRPPGWILRWGITFIFLAVAVLLTIGWMVRYPEIIEADVILTTENPPVHLFAQSSGRLTNLLVDDKEEINANVLLAVLENPSVWEDVLALEDLLFDMKKGSKENIPEDLVLGELQKPFSNFVFNLKDFDNFKGKKEVKKKVQALKSQIRYLRRMNGLLIKQEDLASEEIETAKKAVARQENLYADKAVSLASVEEAESNLSQQRRRLENLKSETLDNKMKIKQLEVNIIDLESGRVDDSNSKQLALDENISTLQGEIDKWKRRYLIYSPIKGQVSFSKKINEQQFVQSGEELMTILPKEGMGEIIGNALLPSQRFGKVTPDMLVNIRLAGFPYKEFGSVEAVVKDISTIPQEDGNYLVNLKIPNKLITTYGKEINFQQEMKGTARIITEDRRILERIFDEFLSLMKN